MLPTLEKVELCHEDIAIRSRRWSEDLGDVMVFRQVFASKGIDGQVQSIVCGVGLVLQQRRFPVSLDQRVLWKAPKPPDIGKVAREGAGLLDERLGGGLEADYLQRLSVGRKPSHGDYLGSRRGDGGISCFFFVRASAPQKEPAEQEEEDESCKSFVDFVESGPNGGTFAVNAGGACTHHGESLRNGI